MNSLSKDFQNSHARIALIDADSVLYAAALGAEGILKNGSEDGDEYIQLKDGEQLYDEVTRTLQGLTHKVGAEDAIICLTATQSCFRYHLLPSYKGNRATMRRPAFLKALQYLVLDRKPFRTMAVRGLEADDICGISQGSLQKANLREPIIVSIDKDMQQIPGLNYSWIGKEPTIKEFTRAEGDRMFLMQTLVGDVVDNYTGCPGIGKVKAGKLLDLCADASEWVQWEHVLGAFKKKGLTGEYALTQARVARILRSSDWNPKTHEVTLWTPTAQDIRISTTATAPCPSKVSRASLESRVLPSVLALKDLPKDILKDRETASVH